MLGYGLINASKFGLGMTPSNERADVDKSKVLTVETWLRREAGAAWAH